MEHSDRCENATRPTCVCSTCGGSRHGWIGHLRRAEGSPDEIRSLREPADRVWREQKARHDRSRRRTPTQYLRRAGGGVAVAALVAWLAKDERTRADLWELGDTVRETVFEQDLRAYARERAAREPAFAEYGREMVGHFWCDVLAEIANVLERGVDHIDKVPEYAREALFAGEDAPAWGPVRRQLAEAALRFLWRSLQVLLGADLGSVVVQLRVLAVLMCPDPGGHARIGRTCLRPLVAETLAETVRTDLDPEWLWQGRP